VLLQSLPPDSFEEVYQSEIQMGQSPLFSTLLLLPLENSNGTLHNDQVLPLRFEVWVGVKRATPDTKHASFLCTLSSIIKDLGTPSDRSCWALVGDQTEVELRLAHPDRLTSIIIPTPQPASSYKVG